MLQALNTGHDGSLTTVHANSPADALRRVETLALMAGVGLPHAAVREQVASAVDVVVHQARRGDGSRAVESVTEVVRAAGGAGVREIYRRGARLRAPREARWRRGSSGSAARERRGGLAFAAAGLGALALAEASHLLGRVIPGAAARLAKLVDSVVRLGREGRDPGRRGAARLWSRPRPRGWAPARWWAARAWAPRSPRPVRGGCRGCCARAGERYRAAVQAGIPAAAEAIADALSGGHSLRGALMEAARSGGGAPGHELRRWRRSSPGGSHRGRPGGDASALRQRCGRHARGGLPRAEASRGDLAQLLRDCARTLEEQRRLEREVSAATAQARFTGLLVVLLPLGGALLAELASPGFLAGLWALLPDHVAGGRGTRASAGRGSADQAHREGALVIQTTVPAFLAGALGAPGWRCSRDRAARTAAFDCSGCSPSPARRLRPPLASTSMPASLPPAARRPPRIELMAAKTAAALAAGAFGDPPSRRRRRPPRHRRGRGLSPRRLPRAGRVALEAGGARGPPRRDLPLLLDLLRVQTEAGASLPAALREVGARARGPLAAEWGPGGREVELGVPLGRALAALEVRLPPRGPRPGGRADRAAATAHRLGTPWRPRPARPASRWHAESARRRPERARRSSSWSRSCSSRRCCCS